MPFTVEVKKGGLWTTMRGEADLARNKVYLPDGYSLSVGELLGAQLPPDAFTAPREIYESLAEAQAAREGIRKSAVDEVEG